MLAALTLKNTCTIYFRPFHERCARLTLSELIYLCSHLPADCLLKKMWLLLLQLLLKSVTMYFADGTIVGGSKDDATGLMVITSGQVRAPVAAY
jgi:hypothetical protein